MVSVVLLAILIDMILVLLILLETPLKKTKISSLDEINRSCYGTSMLIVVGNIIFLVMIQKRGMMGHLSLETNLIVLSLLLAFVIDRLHCRLASLEKSMACNLKRIKELEEENACLNLRLRHNRNHCIQFHHLPLHDQNVDGYKKSLNHLTRSFKKNVAVNIERVCHLDLGSKKNYSHH